MPTEDSRSRPRPPASPPAPPRHPPQAPADTPADPGRLAEARRAWRGVRDAAPPRLLRRDEGRLASAWHRLDDPRQPPGARALSRFEDQVGEALTRAARWQAGLPAPDSLAFPENLPVVQARDDILRTLAAHQVTVLCGETGSGKTTQLPKLLLALGRGAGGLIGHTQPRRLAARSVASRIAQETGGALGGLIGFETRFEKRFSEGTRVKLMTDGILLAELARDRDLAAYDTLIIDEAHERSLNIDFLLGYLKRLLPRRPDLKIVITSATLDPERLAWHFSRHPRPRDDAGARPPDVPVLEVSGRTYPVEVIYLPPEPDAPAEDAVGDAIDALWEGGRRAADTLVFLPGEGEIRELARSLAGRFPRAQVLPLYSRLPGAQQDRVFATGGAPKIVLSTNVAETSVTVPGIRFVIDTGTARVNRFSARLGIQQLKLEPVSQASANQRAGRCGRTGPGVAVRLYAEDDFKARPVFTEPEILRAGLAGVILQMAGLGLGDINDYPWVDPPDTRQVNEGLRLLQMLGALDDDNRLTPLGRRLARLPLDPRIARVALAGAGTPAEDDVFALAAALSVQDPHEVPPDAETQARQKHATWRHPRSDFLTLLGLWRRWREWKVGASQRQLRKTCQAHYVNYSRLEEWDGVYRQVRDMLRARPDEGGAPTSAPAAGKAPDDGSPEALDRLYEPLHQALLAGLVDHIGVKRPEAEKRPGGGGPGAPQGQGRERYDYTGPRGRVFRLFPGSVTAKKQPPWVMCAQIVETRQVFAHTVAALEPAWLEVVAPHLIRRALGDPVWNPARGSVSATETLTLFGLHLGTRARHYGSTHPAEAREIFIREALVRGNMARLPAVIAANRQVMADLQEKETRLRRPDLLGPEAQLEAFYANRLPEDVCTTAGLDRWLKTPGPGDARDAHARQLKMAEADALRPGANADIGALFPDHLVVAGARVRLTYRHDPGAASDGVVFHIPLSRLGVLPAEPFDWLVPGLLPGRIEGLIRTLPQHLRRLCQPAGPYAEAIAASVSPEGDLLATVVRRFVEMTGVRLEVADFQPEKLESHLQPHFVVEDAKGAALAEGASLARLREHLKAPAREALSAAARSVPGNPAAAWVRGPLADWDFDALPPAVTLPGGGGRAWPALALVAPPAAAPAPVQRNKHGAPLPAPAAPGPEVHLRLFESPAAAAASHAPAARQLLLQKLGPGPVRDLARAIKARAGAALATSGFTADDLAADLAERLAREVLLPEAPTTKAAFQAGFERRGEFLRQGLAAADEVGSWLDERARLLARARAVGVPESREDMVNQLDSLFAARFPAHIPAGAWARVGVYLKALSTRLDRQALKPARDAELARLVLALARALPGPCHPARWVLEEWRLAQFAQELRPLGAPTEAKVRAALSS